MGKRAKPPHGPLLAAVAEALNACEAAGLHVRLKHGVITTAGYVLPAWAGWVPRTLEYTEFSPNGDEED